MSAETLIPAKISNRRLIEQMGRWGWTPIRKRGDQWTMHHPTTGESITVIAPHVHAFNGSVVLGQVYRLTTGGDAALFWSRRAPGIVPEFDGMVDAVRNKHAGDDAEFFIDRTTGAIDVAVYEPEPTTTPTTEGTTTMTTSPEPMPLPDDDETSESFRGAASAVLCHLEAHPHESFNGPTLAAALGIPQKVCTNALAYLGRKGHAERLMRGTYRLVPSLAADRTVRHAGPVAVQHATEGIAPVVALPAQRPAPAPEPVPAPVAPDSDGDDLDALLELIVPEGYQFNPRHLSAMLRWQRETARLLEVLRS